MTYLIYVAMFGCGATLFLWLRDARIFFRTGLPGYRRAAYWGVLYGALSMLGLQITLKVPDLEILGLGLILAGIYLIVNQKKEKVWNKEGTLQRFIGSVPISRTNKKQ